MPRARALKSKGRGLPSGELILGGSSFCLEPGYIATEGEEGSVTVFHWAHDAPYGARPSVAYRLQCSKLEHGSFALFEFFRGNFIRVRPRIALTGQHAHRNPSGQSPPPPGTSRSQLIDEGLRQWEGNSTEQFWEQRDARPIAPPCGFTLWLSVVKKDFVTLRHV